MACSTCGGGSMAAQAQAQRTAAMNNEEVNAQLAAQNTAEAKPIPEGDIRFEYLGGAVGHIEYGNNPSGRAYLAGNNPQNKFIDVAAIDAPKFDGLAGTFRRVTPITEAERPSGKKAPKLSKSEAEQKQLAEQSAIQAQANNAVNTPANFMPQTDVLTEEQLEAEKKAATNKKAQ